MPSPLALIGASLILFYFSLAERLGYCTPGSSCFPDLDTLRRFNGSIDGRLLHPAPYGQLCYKDTYNAETCRNIVQAKHDPIYRLGLPAGLMYTNIEQDGIHGCPVPEPLGNVSLGPVKGKCTSGRMSAFVVNASSEEHIARSVVFARRWRLKLRIKNTGHDYAGRSSGPGTFAIWTRHMKDLRFIDDFRLCYASRQQAVIAAGSGVSVEELYAFAGAHDVTVMAGYSATVGAAGGFVLGGGIGPLGHFLGMGVDNVVQFDVITADGRKKIANECSNRDLFWALRGGGAAFGVVTRVYFKTHSPLHAINILAGTVTCNNAQAYQTFINRLVDMQMLLRSAGYVGLWTAHSGQRSTTMLWLRPFFQGATVQSTNESDQIFESVLDIHDCMPTTRTVQVDKGPVWSIAYQNILKPVLDLGATVGINVINISRLISYDLMNNPKRLNSVKEYIHNLPPGSRFIWQNSVGEASSKVRSDATAVHPEWRNAFAYMNSPVFGSPVGVTSAQMGAVKSVVDNANEVFGSAAYYNENWGIEKDWRTTNWGANYGKLMKIKKDVDPHGVFSCRRCVGSNGDG